MELERFALKFFAVKHFTRFIKSMPPLLAFILLAGRTLQIHADLLETRRKSIDELFFFFVKRKARFRSSRG
jgi:hypothetical protein